MEAMVSGQPRGWYAYKEIEWLQFPRCIGNETQELEAIQRAIKAVGQLRLAVTEDELRLYAYWRP